MGTILNRSKYALVLLLTLFATTSCFFDGSDDDNAAEWSMVGTWYVRQVAGYNSPYQRGDTFVFRSNRTFYTYDPYSDRPLDNGQWNIQNHQLIISFDNWSASIVADMSNFPDNEVMLNVRDADYGNYSLYLVRDY